jgi:hypothetical protein
VSPGDTVLDSVNAWIDRLDQRTLYTMIGLPGLLPPDGPLPLGQPVVFDGASRGLRILSLDAHKGEVLIGRGGNQYIYGSGPQSRDQGFAFLRVYGPDGSEVYDAQGILDGQSFTVPADGRYTFAFQHYGRGAGTATVWDYADAPASVQQLSPGGHPTCTFTQNSSSCSSSGASSVGGNIGSAESGGIGASGTATTVLIPTPTSAVPSPTTAVPGAPIGASINSSATSVPHG